MLTLTKIAIWLLQCYFIFYTVYVVVAAMGALLFKMRSRVYNRKVTNHQRFAMMIPAYRANMQLQHVIDACYRQTYPGDKFNVFVLAQHCTPDIVQMARRKKCTVFEQEFDHRPGNSYLHALNYFIRQIEKTGKYDNVVLIDKDNLLAEDFLEKINSRFQQGYIAVQGQRRPMNLDTNAARMDYIAEVMNDQMLRAAKAALGLSPELSGSGMAFEFQLYKQAIAAVDFNSPVHDKTFLIELIKREVRICYEPQAVLYEEKTGSFSSVSQQRTRWIGGQLYLLRKNFIKLIKMSINQRRWEPVDYALTLAKIPRSIHVAGLVGWCCFSLVLPAMSTVKFGTWLLLFCVYGASISFMLWLAGAPRIVYRALLSSPLFVISIIRSTWRSIINRDKSKFLHTDHSREIAITELNNHKEKQSNEGH